jgi:hypothetical protein
MDREARPKIMSIGNSLTSISSLTTLPPSPIAHRSRSAHVGAVSGKKPSNLDVDPLSLHPEPPTDENERPVSPLGSVPSPKPRFAHLIASAPVRPRLPRRPASSPSYTNPRIPSPLNPASQHLKPTPPPSFNPVDGSVPNPKPNRLFTSLFYHPPSPPTTTDPILPRDQEAADRYPPRLRNGQKGSAPRKISPSGFNDHSAPARPASKAVSETEKSGAHEEEEVVIETKTENAPNSFSTFVASIESLR